jgi:hypothetical protein
MSSPGCGATDPKIWIAGGGMAAIWAQNLDWGMIHWSVEGWEEWGSCHWLIAIGTATASEGGGWDDGGYQFWFAVCTQWLESREEKVCIEEKGKLGFFVLQNLYTAPVMSRF